MHTLSPTPTPTNSSLAALSPHPHGDCLATVTVAVPHTSQTCFCIRVQESYHPSAFCSLPSLLSRSRIKVISVEPFLGPLCTLWVHASFFLCFTYTSFCFFTTLYNHVTMPIHIFISCPPPCYQKIYCMRAGLFLFCSQLYLQHQEQIWYSMNICWALVYQFLSSQGWSVIWFYGCYFIPFCLSSERLI